MDTDTERDRKVFLFSVFPCVSVVNSIIILLPRVPGRVPIPPLPE